MVFAKLGFGLLLSLLLHTAIASDSTQLNTPTEIQEEARPSRSPAESLNIAQQQLIHSTSDAMTQRLLGVMAKAQMMLGLFKQAQESVNSMQQAELDPLTTAQSQLLDARLGIIFAHPAQSIDLLNRLPKHILTQEQLIQSHLLKGDAYWQTHNYDASLQAYARALTLFTSPFHPRHCQMSLSTHLFELMMATQMWQSASRFERMLLEQCSNIATRWPLSDLLAQRRALYQDDLHRAKALSAKLQLDWGYATDISAQMAILLQQVKVHILTFDAHTAKRLLQQSRQLLNNQPNTYWHQDIQTLNIQLDNAQHLSKQQILPHTHLTAAQTAPLEAAVSKLWIGDLSQSHLASAQKLQRFTVYLTGLSLSCALLLGYGVRKRLQCRHLQARLSDITKSNQCLNQSARVDVLTGLHNRRHLQEQIYAEAARHQRNRSPFSLAIMDIDHFKQFNDNFGHDCGDHVLTHTAQVIKQHIRQQDLAGRWGGEEFLLLLPDTQATGAKVLCEKVRRQIQQTPTSYKLKSHAVTVSIGVAELIPGMSIEQTLHLADVALYKAKSKGRNKVVVSQ